MSRIASILIATVLTGCGSLKTQSDTIIVKVLPHYLDASGYHTDGTTLLHRDGYQDKLRKNPDLVHGVRYDVNWRGTGEVKMRLELRSSKAGTENMVVERGEANVSRRRRWTSILIDTATYKAFGKPESWRVSLWRDETLVSEQKSFLW